MLPLATTLSYTVSMYMIGVSSSILTAALNNAAYRKYARQASRLSRNSFAVCVLLIIRFLPRWPLGGARHHLFQDIRAQPQRIGVPPSQQ